MKKISEKILIFCLILAFVPMCREKAERITKFSDKKFSGELLNGKETGEWSYFDSTGVVQQKGDYKNGLKNGLWTYVIREKLYQVTWSPIEYSDSLLINIPDSFKVSNKHKEYIFIAIKKRSHDTNSFRDNIIITNFKYDSFQSLKKCVLYSDSIVTSSYDVKAKDLQGLFLNEDSVYYLTYEIMNNNKHIYSFSVVKKLSNDIIFITFNTSSIDFEYSELLFNSIIENVYFKNERFIDPYIVMNEQ